MMTTPSTIAVAPLALTLLSSFALAAACSVGEIGGAATFGPVDSAGGDGVDDDGEDGGDGKDDGPADGPLDGPDDGAPADGDGPGDGQGDGQDDGQADGKGDCCLGNGTPGCDDPEVEACVCAQDDFCCTNVWDDLCAQLVEDNGCAPCGPPADGGGADDGGDMGGGDTGGGDPGGGDPGGDEAGGGEAGGGEAGGGEAGGECPIGFGDCCLANNSVGCDDCEIETCVCALDSYCCDTDWDGICVDQATDNCGACGGPGDTGGSVETGGGTTTDAETTGSDTGDCCDPDNGTPGCDDAVVEACVCALDSFCCDTEWDDICVGEAQSDCDACGGVGTTTGAGETTGSAEETGGGETGGDVGDCCTEHETTGCSVAEIESCVCGADAFCCDVEWDGLCVGAVDDCDGFACPA